MTPRTRSAIVADGRERLERALADLPDAERREAVRRAESDPGPVRRALRGAWPGPDLPPLVLRFLRQQVGCSVDRRLFLRAPAPTRPHPAPKSGARRWRP